MEFPGTTQNGDIGDSKKNWLLFVLENLSSAWRLFCSWILQFLNFTIIPVCGDSRIRFWLWSEVEDSCARSLHNEKVHVPRHCLLGDFGGGEHGVVVTFYKSIITIVVSQSKALKCYNNPMVGRVREIYQKWVFAGIWKFKEGMRGCLRSFFKRYLYFLLLFNSHFSLWHWK